MRIKGHANRSEKIARRYYVASCDCGWRLPATAKARNTLIQYRFHLLTIRNEREISA